MISKSSTTMIFKVLIWFLFCKAMVQGSVVFDYPRRDGCPMNMKPECMEQVSKEMSCGDLTAPVFNKVSDVCCINLYYNYLEDCFFRSLVQDVARINHCQRSGMDIHHRADQIWDL
ncbi:hypothetical protein SASPL_123112 [Salvia splendens]|uniref:Prolamin-like domain-containing protein n=1 Tax=Salvia splendens TaxID=180675 RepID=A0A8X8XPL9_SALSN|nr:hypothetical protein SASPL_123112 [Salvia splendens]